MEEAFFRGDAEADWEAVVAVCAVDVETIGAPGPQAVVGHR